LLPLEGTEGMTGKAAVVAQYKEVLLLVRILIKEVCPLRAH